MSKKQTGKKFIILKLQVHIPLAFKLEEAERLTPTEYPHGHPKEGLFFNRPVELRNNQIRLLGNDLDEPFRLLRLATDGLFLLFESFTIVAFDMVDDIGIYDCNLVTTEEDAKKWVDTASIKRVAE